MMIKTEPNNCFPVALSHVCSAPEEQIVAVCRSHGLNKERPGMPVEGITSAMTDLGLSYHQYLFSQLIDKSVDPHATTPMTTKQFCKHNPHGTFVCCTKGHAFVVHNGKVIDTNMRRLHSRARVWRAYVIFNADVDAHNKGERLPDDPLFKIIRRNPFRAGTDNHITFIEMVREHNLQYDSTIRLSQTGFSRSTFRKMLRKGHVELVKE